jgi:hypothetical protein
MDELSRIIGSVESELKAINKNIASQELKLDGLIADFEQRKGMRKVMYALCGLIGTAGGILGGLIKSIFTAPPIN